MKTLLLVGILAAASAAALAAPPPHDPSLEIGARYWLSSGKTRWAHNAQDAAPILGNPTSVLTYERLGAQTVELHARKTLGAAWFIKGNAGAGWINRGSFDDEDYFVGQLKFSDTTSSVRGNRVAYATLDAGRAVLSSRDGGMFLFAGYQEWTERADAYGLSYTVPAGAPGLGDNTPAVSNEVRWRSIRLGAGLRSGRGHARRCRARVGSLYQAAQRRQPSPAHRSQRPWAGAECDQRGTRQRIAARPRSTPGGFQALRARTALPA